MRALDWFVRSPCACCRRFPRQNSPMRGFCETCRLRLHLPEGGIRGSEPLPWWAAGPYEGSLRALLLDLRRHPRAEALACLIQGMGDHLPGRREPILLVPIPSWKRHANPLPALLCRELGRLGNLPSATLLERSHPVLGQHHLKRELRHTNQEGSFLCRHRPSPADHASHRRLLIVDDILTTGATACSAAASLKEAGWQVVGAICLARTPKRRAGPGGGDLRSLGR